MTEDGSDVTAQFLAGARQALAVARTHRIQMAVLKDGSPSCATGSIHDGTFRGRKRPGAGVTAALLAGDGIKVFSESQLEEAAEWLRHIETRARS